MSDQVRTTGNIAAGNNAYQKNVAAADVAEKQQAQKQQEAAGLCGAASPSQNYVLREALLGRLRSHQTDVERARRGLELFDRFISFAEFRELLEILGL